MQLKPAIISSLVAEGLTELDLQELASRLLGTAVAMDAAAAAAQSQLEFNTTERIGIEATLADATAKANRAKAMITKITVAGPK